MGKPKENNVVEMPNRQEEMSQAVRDAFGMGEATSESARRFNELVEKAKLEREGQRAEKSVEKVEHTKAKDEREQIRFISVNRVTRSPFQTRDMERDSSLEDLSKSIEQKGVVQPILVRPTDTDQLDYSYELIAGERRLEAAKLAGLEEIPALVYDLSDREAVEVQIIENAQRENLNPVEEAHAIKNLISQFKITQTEASEVIGKNRTTISNALRLLSLPPEILELLTSGELSAGHGRALVGVDDPGEQIKLAYSAVKNGYSVRKLEEIVADLNELEFEEISEEEERDLQTLKRQTTRLMNLLDMEEGITLKRDQQGRKRLSIVFDSEASWKRFMSRLR